MGGSDRRGWGALAGSVDVQINDLSGDRVSAIKLTLTAVLSINCPKSASVDAPAALERMSADSEETKPKEITLLYME